MMRSGLVVGTLLCVLLAGPLSGADPGISLVGTGLIPGNLLDHSGLAGSPICRRDDLTDCIDQATLGGFGSGLTNTGYDNVFVATPDRGPFDGRTDVPYLDRFHLLRIVTDAKAASFPNITTTLLDTRFLIDEQKRNFVGDAYAFDTADPSGTLRFDPEAVVMGRRGTILISDEYGPYVREFDRHGRLLRRIALPSKFALDPETGTPSGDLDSGGNSMELYPALNVTGRQANRGMEGLAITPDGRTLVGIVQNALLQDHGINPSTIGRVGINNRIVVIDLVTGRTREHVYVMDAVNQGRGINDLLAINDHEFLVLERDNRSLVPTPPNTPQTPNLKRIYKIDLAQPGLTDVSDVESLPQGALDPSIVPLAKTLFLDLLDPSYVVSTNPLRTVRDVIAEKVEALAWGGETRGGRLLLYVVTDNDLYPNLPTQIYAFAIDLAAAGIKWRPQTVLRPVFFPWESRASH
jgi:hypothetical protein